jgi:hypothetical protein
MDPSSNSRFTETKDSGPQTWCKNLASDGVSGRIQGGKKTPVFNVLNEHLSALYPAIKKLRVQKGAFRGIKLIDE